MRQAAIVCAIVASFPFAAGARADVVVTNLAEPFRATSEIGNNPNPTPPPSKALEWSWAAQSFTTDDNSYSLTLIDIIGGEASMNPAPVIVARLHADDGGVIGAVITTLTPSDFTGPPAPRSLTPDNAVTLQPLTTYWVMLGSEAPGDGTLGWSYANSNESVGTGVIAQYADSQDSGATWNYGVKFPYFIQVVAEPAAKICSPDLNGDGVVNSFDLALLLGAWGKQP